MKKFGFVFLGWVVFAAGVLLALSGCVGRGGSRNFGGMYSLTLRPGEKLAGASWKDSSLWVLTRKSREGELPESYVFREVSRMGWLEGQVTIQER